MIYYTLCSHSIVYVVLNHAIPQRFSKSVLEMNGFLQVSLEESVPSKPDTCYLPIWYLFLDTIYKLLFCLCTSLFNRAHLECCSWCILCHEGAVWLICVWCWWLLLLYPCSFIQILKGEGTSVQLVKIRYIVRQKTENRFLMPSVGLCSCSAHTHLESCCKTRAYHLVKVADSLVIRCE